MIQLHTLTVRTTAARGRLADLQRRAEHAGAATTPVVKPALRELTRALEDLQAAGEQLEAQGHELAASRKRSDELSSRLDEFVQVVPIACIWTDQAGLILEANEAAAALLNVARPRLAGKPFMLFMGDRQSFFEALRALGASSPDAAELHTIVRPRERRPRVVRLRGTVMAHDARRCWFIRPAEEIDLPPVADSEVAEKVTS